MDDKERDETKGTGDPAWEAPVNPAQAGGYGDRADSEATPPSGAGDAADDDESEGDEETP